MDLVDNGMHSFKKAFTNLIELESNDAEEIKYRTKDIILDLHHSLEVLFKYMLQKKDNALMYEEFDNYLEDKFNQIIGDKSKKNSKFHTVKFMQAFKRVIIYYDIKIDKITYDSVKKLNKVRNELIHNTIVFDFAQIRMALANLLFNILPILENVEEFKQYINQNEIRNQINNLGFIRAEWQIQTITFLIQNYEHEKQDITTKDRYEKILKEYNFYELELEEEISKEEFILSKFERIFYKDKWRYLYIDKVRNDDLIYQYWREYKEIYDKTTIKIIKNKIKDSINIIFDYGRVCELEIKGGEIIKEVYNKFKNLDVGKKLRVGEICKGIQRIVKQVEEIEDRLGSSKKIINRPLKYSYKDIQVVDCAEDEFELSTKSYLKCLEKCYSEECMYFKGESEYENIISDEREDRILIFISENGYDYAWERLMGNWGEWGTIDNVDEINVYNLQCIKRWDTNKFIAYCELEVGTQTYVDHEFYSNGTSYINVGLEVEILQNDSLMIKRMFSLEANYSVIPASMVNHFYNEVI